MREILEPLSTVLTYWTSILLVWGIAVGVQYSRILHNYSVVRATWSKRKTKRIFRNYSIRPCDRLCLVLIWLVNIMFAGFLCFLEVVLSAPDVVIVLDIWSTLLITYVTMDVVKWPTIDKDTLNQSEAIKLW